jgi:hypothetical protein
MATISKVESLTTYRIQFNGFLVVSTVGFVSGVFALFPYSWAARGLLAASLAISTFYLGIAAYAVIFPFVPWTTLKEPGLAALPISLLLAVMSAGQAIPFVFIAWAVLRALRGSTG